MKCILCDKPHYGKGYCRNHYYSFRRYGDATVKKLKVIRHGHYHSPEHISWLLMKRRCYNKNDPTYQRYGNKGVKVCDEWINDFPAFNNYVGDKPSPQHTLDRIDNKKGYEPGNVRWATKSEQAINRGLSTLNKSGYRGVCRDTKTGKWVAYIKHNYQMRLGQFEDKLDAALAYDIAAVQVHGELAHLNILGER